MIDLNLGEILSTASAVLWSIALIFFKKAGETVGPSALNLFKNTVALPLIGLTAVLAGSSLAAAATPFNLGMMAASGILGMALGDSLVLASLSRLGAGWTAVVGATYSPVMIAVTWGLYDVPLTASVAIGTALIAAAILIAARSPGDGSRSRREVLIGLALGVGGQLAMAVSMAMLKYPTFGQTGLLESEDAFFVSFWRVLFGAIALMVWMGATQRGRAQVKQLAPSPVWKVMVPGALVGTWLAVIVWIAGMKYIDGSLVRAAILNQTTVIWLPILGAIFLKEAITGRKLAAIGLAFFGAVIIVLAP